MPRKPRPSLYDLEALVTSESHPEREPWQIKRHRVSGELSCNCPSWVFHKGPVKTCKHVVGFAAGHGRPASVAIAEAMNDAVNKRRTRGKSERMSVVVTHPHDASISPVRAIVLPD